MNLPHATGSNGYVKIRCLGEKKKAKTRVCPKTCDPVWDEVLTVTVAGCEAKVPVSVWAKSSFRKNKILGVAELDLKPICDGEMHTVDLPLLCVSHDHPRGNLFVEVLFPIPRELDTVDSPPSSPDIANFDRPGSPSFSFSSRKISDQRPSNCCSHAE